MKVDLKDLAGGAAVSIIGVFFLVTATRQLDIGSAFQMGPGYFPMMLGGILALLGVLQIIRSFGRSTSTFGTVPWRAIVLTCLGPIIFGLTIEGLGLVPSLALTVVAAALASDEVNIKRLTALTIAITVFCVLLFHFALSLSIPLFGFWIRGIFEWKL